MDKPANALFRNRGGGTVIGTLVNAAAIIAGGLIGTLAGNRLPLRAKKTAMDGLGLATVAIGFKMSLETGNVLYVLGGLLVLAVGLGLLEVKKIKVANLLPAVLFAPLLAYLASQF